MKASTYNFTQLFFLSFYSKKMYRDVAAERSGMGILFLFATTIIISIPVIFLVYSQDLKREGEVDAFFSSAVPFDIKNGKLIVDVSKPLYFPSVENPSIVIDLNGDASKFEKYGKIFLITKDKLFYRTIKNTPGQNLDLSTFQSKSKLVEYIKEIYGLGILKKIISPLFVIGFDFTFRILWVLFSGAIALFVQRFWDYKMTFKQLVRLAVIAGTPPSLLIAILYLAMPAEQMPIFLIGSILTLLFYFGIVRWAGANKKVHA